MKVVIFGATGMIGHGALKECLRAPDVDEIVTVGRRPAPESDARLTQVIHDDFADLGAIADALRDADACFYCLGISSTGMSEARYREITYDYTVAAANAVHRASPDAVFCFVSGAGTDRDSGQMWARVKAEAEDAVAAVGFPAAYMFRPGYIQPMDGLRSTVKSYNAMYAVLSPLYPLLRKMPKWVTSTREVGQAMLNAVRRGPDTTVLESADICALAA